MASHPRPRFFLSRPDGTIVPLIPLDELPEDIIIPGVPRTMSLAETAGMVSLGRVGPPESFYLVDSQNDIPTPVANGRGREVNNSPKNKKVRSLCPFRLSQQILLIKRMKTDQRRQGLQTWQRILLLLDS